MALQVLAQQERIQRGQGVHQLQHLAVVAARLQGIAEGVFGLLVESLLADMDRARAELQVVAVDGQQHLGGDAAVAVEHLPFVRPDAVLDDDALVQQRVLEHGRQAHFRVVLGLGVRRQQVQHARRRRRLLQGDEAADVAVGDGRHGTFESLAGGRALQGGAPNG